MSPAADRGRSYWTQNGASWDSDVDEVVKAIVDDGVGVVDGEELDRRVWSVNVYKV
jgi:hypothetical protein